MIFSDALKLMHEGKHITRDSWDTSGEYVTLMPGMQYIWKISIIPNPSAGNWMPLVSDLEATDYKTVEKKVKDETIDPA